MTTQAVKAKLIYAIKKDGFNVHKMNFKPNPDGSFSVGMLITNEKSSDGEEDADVIRQDYRIKQIEEEKLYQIYKQVHDCNALKKVLTK